MNERNKGGKAREKLNWFDNNYKDDVYGAAEKSNEQPQYEFMAAMPKGEKRASS